MEAQEAVAVLSLLSDGIDPVTGEEFDSESPYQHPKILRALFCGIRALEQTRRIDAKGRILPAAAGGPWTPDEEAELLRRFDAALPIAEIARTHERTTGAIRSRLTQLGLLRPEKFLPQPRLDPESSPTDLVEFPAPDDLPF